MSPACYRPSKSLLVANLALALAAGKDRAGFTVPAARRVLICQFELPTAQFVARLATMRGGMGAGADQNLLVDTGAAGHLLSAPQGLSHFLYAARQAAAEVIVLDPLYSTHDQDENGTRAMAALCQSLLRLRDAAQAALIVVHHVRKSIGRGEIGSAFRGSSALHAVGDTYLLLTRAAQPVAVELRFQFRYAAPQPPRLLELDSANVVVFRNRLAAMRGCCAEKGGIRRCATSAQRSRCAGSVQPAAAADHRSDRLFQAYRSTGHSRGLSLGRGCPAGRSLPPPMPSPYQ